MTYTVDKTYQLDEAHKKGRFVQKASLQAQGVENKQHNGKATRKSTAAKKTAKKVAAKKAAKKIPAKKTAKKVAAKKTAKKS